MKPNEGEDELATGQRAKKGGRISAIRKLIQRFKSAILIDQIGHRLNRTERNGYELARKPAFHYLFKKVPNYARLYDAWTTNNRGNIVDMARFYMLYLNVQQVLNEELPGDIVELGVYRGNSAALLAMLAREKGRQLYLFDTFTGFDRSDLIGHDSHRDPEFADTSLEMVKALVGIENVQYVQGLFPESCRQIHLPEKIVIAHIDCDLYKPIKAGLEHFYPRVVPGGIVIIHDYGSGYWPGATQAVNEFFADKPERPVLIPDHAGTAIIRKAL